MSELGPAFILILDMGPTTAEAGRENEFTIFISKSQSTHEHRLYLHTKPISLPFPLVSSPLTLIHKPHPKSWQAVADQR